jgi:methylsterol monooxygenase
MSFTNNFSTSFRWWDRILGTDDKFQAYKRLKRLGGGSHLLDGVEKEGKLSEREVEKRAVGYTKEL